MAPHVASRALKKGKTPFFSARDFPAHRQPLAATQKITQEKSLEWHLYLLVPIYRYELDFPPLLFSNDKGLHIILRLLYVHFLSHIAGACKKEKNSNKTG